MARFLIDTSALAKLYHQEEGSDFVRTLVDSSPDTPFVTRLTLIEMESVWAIRMRTGQLLAAEREICRARFAADLARGRLILSLLDGERVGASARQLVAKFGAELGLRTLDAIQLATALSLKANSLVSGLVSADARLCRVSEACGCPALNPSDLKGSIREA